MFKPRRLHRLTADFDLVTPAFCGGADPDDGLAELRLPSLLGALRFWWRALAWSRADGHDETDRLRAIAGWEQQLFGSARTGQGSFVARLRKVRPVVDGYETDRRLLCGGYVRKRFVTDRNRPWMRHSTGVAYLAGQGLTKWVPAKNRDGEPNAHPGVQDRRKSLPPGSSFTVEFTSRHSTPWSLPDAPGAPSIKDALLLMGLVGNLGSRSRRGFGSLRLVGGSLDVPSTVDSYLATLKRLLGDVMTAAELPPYSAFASSTRLVAVQSRLAGDSAELHNEMGHRLQHYRSWGAKDRNGEHMVGGRQARQKFRSDHQWLESLVELGEATPKDLPALMNDVPAPERAIFGLPHNYTKSRSPFMVDLREPNTDRRASPLFLHIHTFEHDDPVAIWLLLESQFLPTAREGDGVDVKIQRFKRAGPRRRQVGQDIPVKMKPDYAPIRKFLTNENLLAQGQTGHRFDVILAGPGEPS